MPGPYPRSVVRTPYPYNMTSHQPGRLPASVYRRRRLVVGLALLAIIVVIVLLIVRPGAGDQTVEPGGAETSKASTPATDPASASDPCDPSVIVIRAATDKGSYQAGETPMLSMVVENTGAVACTLDVGTDVKRFDIVSGSDPIWNSADCLGEPVAFQQVLEPGVELTTTPFGWDRTRSAPDTCDSARPEVIAGGATYRLSVSLGDVTSDSDVPFLLY